MGGNPLAELLNRLLRGADAEPSSVAIEFVHRGAPGDTDTVFGDEVTRASARGLELDDDRKIPLHRVLAVRSGGVLCWSRREPEDGPS